MTALQTKAHEVSESIQGITATLDQIQRIAARRVSLRDAQIEAELQLFHRIGTEYRAGNLTVNDLANLYYAYHDCLPEPGFTTRWDAAIPFTAKLLVTTVRHGAARPNGPDGSWTGPSNIGPYDPCPLKGTAVVYVLYDQDNDPCYVGSTGQLRARLKQHLNGGKAFSTWRAWECKDRAAAYEREDAMLREVAPYLNRRASR